MTVFIKRNNNKKVIETMNLWFDMVCNYSKRDQLSFMYCVWKTGLNIDDIDLNVCSNDWFDWKNHSTKSEDSYKIYLDYGDGFLEKNVMCGKYKKNGLKRKIDVKIPEKVKNIRFDPTDHYFVYGKNLVIHNVDKSKIQFNNILRNGEHLFFINDDPNIIIETDKINNIKISIELYEDDISAYKIMINMLDKEQQKTKNMLDELIKENMHLNEVISSIYGSRTYKLSRTLSNLLNRVLMRGDRK